MGLEQDEPRRRHVEAEAAASIGLTLPDEDEASAPRDDEAGETPAEPADELAGVEDELADLTPEELAELEAGRDVDEATADVDETDEGDGR